ncbi:hypothetical protein JVX98_13120 [Ensifer sp. PDNC004]|uniref:hypothetical protein n=1 Tax=Ensifer sp. PDNC004 TaxID=2811423 RepID=UPI001963A814|nr:hypothetical protein [Ensifer sp. PDNC004]QRY69159.1 hypothetical protein JVX98_13120 [Ensifer sp. PDNC004]
MKLTKPQWLLLVDVDEGDGKASDTYPPAKKLVELGLCRWEPQKYGQKLVITEAGRKALKEAP